MTTDMIYETSRNRLIPEAELVANRLSGPAPEFGTPAYDAWGAVWNGHFHAAMERLWKQRSGR